MLGAQHKLAGSQCGSPVLKYQKVCMAVNMLPSERHAVTMYMQEGRCYFGNGTVQLVSSCLFTLVMMLGINVLLADSSHIHVLSS